MSSADVIATEDQVTMARQAILTQLGTTGIADNFNSMAEALHELGMWEFVENQARVIAQHWAFDARNAAVIHKLTFERSEA